MKRYQPKKRYSQNFLKDQNVLQKIATIIDLKNQKVIEIGPGQGALTKCLLKVAQEVVAFEIDRNLYDQLKEEYKDEKKLTIINEDFLKADLDQYQQYHIVANIPYHISTDIVFKIFDYYQHFEHVVLLVQKEFAKRICAQVGTKDYGKLAPSTKLFYEATYCFDVQSSSF